MTPRAANTEAAGGELSSDLKALGINLRDLQVRIETAADLETLRSPNGDNPQWTTRTAQPRSR